VGEGEAGVGMVAGRVPLVPAPDASLGPAHAGLQIPARARAPHSHLLNARLSYPTTP